MYSTTLSIVATSYLSTYNIGNTNLVNLVVRTSSYFVRQKSVSVRSNLTSYYSRSTYYCSITTCWGVVLVVRMHTTTLVAYYYA